MTLQNPMLTQRRQIAVKLEAVKGTQLDPVFTGADSKILVMEPKIAPEFGVYDRNFARKSISKLKHLIVDRPARITFKTELRWTRTAVAVPDVWMSLFKACGMFETITPTTGPITYTAESDYTDMKTITMWLWNEGFRHGIKGAMGEVTLVGEIGKPMILKWDFLGSYISPVTDVLSVVTHETGDPVPFQGVGFGWGGTSGDAVDHVLTSFKLKMNNGVFLRKSINDPAGILSAIITSRSPEIELDPETRPDFDYITKMTTNTTVALQVKPMETTASPGLVTFDFPKCQIKNADEGDRDGVLTTPLTLAVTQDVVGDDEFTLKFA